MKTHVVIDLTYHEDEGNQVFVGTLQECNDWVSDQDMIGLEVKPMTVEELRIHNPIISIAKSGKRYHNIPKEIDVEIWDKMTVAERLQYKGLI